LTPPKTDPKKTFNFSLLRRLFAFAAPYRRTFFTTLALSIVLAALSPLRPYLIQISVDRYIGHRLLAGLLWVSGVQLGVLVLESLLRFWFMYRTNWLGQSVVNNLRQEVFRKILFQNVAYYDQTPIGTLTTRTINDVEAVNDVFSEGILSIVADILTIIAIITVMLLTDWRLTLICLAAFPVLLLATYIFKESVHKSFHKVRNAVAQLNAFAQEHITGMYLVQAFAAEDREQKKFAAINKEHRNANIKAIFAYSVFFPVVEIILAISLGLLVWRGAVQMMHDDVTPGVIIAFVMYLNLLFRPLRMLADKFNVLQMGMVASERIFGVLDNEAYLHANGTHQADSIKGDIVFERVHFSYKPGIPVLQGISFHIPTGKTMAVVGHTGAGKTSVISILNRLYEIDGGQIRIDGIPLPEYDIYSLRRRIGIVLQDVFLFSGTILDNITLRDKNIPEAHAINVCRLLGIHDFIMQLPEGYRFQVMERGNTLSQGQRQLLSFARALIYNPSILILDEATSSVDSESEQLIQHAIDTLIKGRTSIVIAHRLSTIRKADEIIVLDKGTITERGTHQKLLQAGGTYYKLYKAVEQAQAMI
jgi:ATP-binding cassette subfamily B protein